MSQVQPNPPSRQEILEALGRYQKQGRVANDVADMAKLLVHESDRGVVVILGSLIEDIMLDRLIKMFVPLDAAQTKNLTRAGGILGSFDHRITLSQALGLIDQDMVEMLQVIKAMRNACAHSRRDISFKIPELRNTLALLFEENVVQILQNPKSGVAPRLIFIIAYAFIFTKLNGESDHTATIKAQRLMDEALIEAMVAKLRLQASREKRTKQPAKRLPHHSKD